MYFATLPAELDGNNGHAEGKDDDSVLSWSRVPCQSINGEWGYAWCLAGFMICPAHTCPLFG